MTPSNESGKEKLRNWLIELVLYFREEFEKLSPEEQEAVHHSLEDLSKPCQFLVIWAKDPEFQIVLVTHSSSLEDKLIEIYGPIENHKLIELIESEVLKSRIVEIIGKEKVEDALISILRIIRSYYDPLVKRPAKPLIDSKLLLSNNPYAASWIVIGNLQNFDSKETASDFIKNIKSSLRTFPPSSFKESSPKEEKVILEGFGTYIYPPIWIGEIPQPKSFREKVTGIFSWYYFRERIIIETYKNRPLVVTKDGFIAIGEKDKWKAQELLNEIMSVLLFRGLSVNVVREVDLGEVKITESGESINIPLSFRALLLQPFIYHSSSEIIRLLPTTHTNDENIRKAIKLAELLTSDDRIKTLLLLFLEAYTYFQNAEYKQSLIIAWVILEEFYIEDLWVQHISKITSDERRLRKLKNWTVDQRLEALHISHVLTDEEYSLLMKIKEARNEVVHEGKMPQKDIAEKCLNLVSRVVQRYIGNYIGMKIHEL
jgi:hypothetical protein